MPRELCVFESIDGELHRDLEKAKGHELDLLGQEVDDLFRQYDKAGRYTRNDIYRLFILLMGTHDKAVKLRDILAATISDFEELD